MSTGFVPGGYTQDYATIQNPLNPRNGQTTAARLPGAGVLSGEAVNVVPLGYRGASMSADKTVAFWADTDLSIGKATTLRAQYIKVDGARLPFILAPKIRIYSVDGAGAEADALALTAMTRIGSTDVWATAWTPAAAGTFIVEIRAAGVSTVATWPLVVRARFDNLTRRS